MNDLLLHACCGPCSVTSVPEWRERGYEPLAWFANPKIQPVAAAERRRRSMERYAAVARLELLVEEHPRQESRWRDWTARAGSMAPAERCATCLGLRLAAAAAAAAALHIPRFSTTLTVSPYQRHDLIVAAGERAAREHGTAFVYLDSRGRFREGQAESRRLELYRQPYCGCAASKWEAWHQRRRRRRTA
jgi:hypothetical protein